MSTPTCCLLSALQALQIATSSVAEAVWSGSGVIVDGMTEWSGAEVVDSRVLDRRPACAVGMEGGLSPR